MIPENENNENKDFEIVMGDNTELNISEVGDIMNNLKPNTSEKKKNIIIPLVKKKAEQKEDNEDEANIEETSEETEDNSEQE